MDARETAERHGAYVVAGNMGGVMADFEPAALQAFGALGIRPPRGVNKAEIVGERQEGSQCIFEIKYSNDAESQTIRSYWEQQGGTWKIVKAEGA